MVRLVAHNSSPDCKVNNYLKQVTKNAATCKTFFERLCVKQTLCRTRIFCEQPRETKRECWTWKNMSPIFKSVVFRAKWPWKLLSCQAFMIKSLWIIKSLKISAPKTTEQTPVSVLSCGVLESFQAVTEVHFCGQIVPAQRLLEKVVPSWLKQKKVAFWLCWDFVGRFMLRA